MSQPMVHRDGGGSVGNHCGIVRAFFLVETKRSVRPSFELPYLRPSCVGNRCANSGSITVLLPGAEKGEHPALFSRGPKLE